MRKEQEWLGRKMCVVNVSLHHSGLFAFYDSSMTVTGNSSFFFSLVSVDCFTLSHQPVSEFVLRHHTNACHLPWAPT